MTDKTHAGDKMMIVGLTGGIATGKSTTAEMIRAAGIPVHDADATVHQLMVPGGAAIAPITAMFGSDMVAEDGSVDRQKLGGVVFGDPDKRRALEAIIHPLVTAHRDRFLEDQRQKNTAMIVLDVPLLFETGGDAACDFVILCYADDQTQRSRGLARTGMTEDKWTAILASQMPMSEKRGRADAVIETQHGLELARQQLAAILEQLRTDPSLPIHKSPGAAHKGTGPNADGGTDI